MKVTVTAVVEIHNGTVTAALQLPRCRDRADCRSGESIRQWRIAGSKTQLVVVATGERKVALLINVKTRPHGL